MPMSDERLTEIERQLHAGIERLKGMRPATRHDLLAALELVDEIKRLRNELLRAEVMPLLVEAADSQRLAVLRSMEIPVWPSLDKGR